MSTNLGYLPALGLLLASPAVFAADCATPGSDGSGVVSGVVNTYWNGTNNPAAGNTSFPLASSTGAGDSILPGDLLLLIQMQETNINLNNTAAYGDGSAAEPASGSTNFRSTGNYEFVRATNTVPPTGGTLNFSSGVLYNYTTQAANAGRRGQRRYQIIRVPQYTDLTISGTLTAAPWDGDRGGIVVIDVANT